MTYTLIESIELRDIRLVYAPPRAVGEYGGEVDNWMWPRHTGDFAIARAYVGPDGRPADRADANVPFKPAFHFPIARKGVDAGDFVVVERAAASVDCDTCALAARVVVDWHD